MTEADWLACDNLEVMLRSFRARRNQATDRKLRLFAVACCRRVRPRLVDERSGTAVEVLEEFLEGRATEEQRREAHLRAGTAYDDLNRVEGFGSPPALAGFAAWSASAEDIPRALGYTLIDAACLTGEGAAEASADPTAEKVAQVALCRDVFGNPFRPVSFSPKWRTSTAVALARQMYESRDFAAMPILADALQDAGCDDDDVLAHCRDAAATHVRGCWVVDLVLGKT